MRGVCVCGEGESGVRESVLYITRGNDEKRKSLG